MLRFPPPPPQYNVETPINMSVYLSDCLEKLRVHVSNIEGVGGGGGGAEQLKMNSRVTVPRV